MTAAWTVGPTLIIAAVLIASGIAKLRTPDDAAGWESLGIPAALRQGWLIRVHPYAELLLAAVLLFVGGPLGIAAAVVAVLLFAAYLAMVWRAKRKTPDASCACFGERRPITTRTLVRNAWLLLVALASAVTIGSAPLWGGIARAAVPEWAWILVLAVAAATVILVREPGSAPAVAAPAGAVARSSASLDDDELEDYVRTRTPAVPVQLGDGTTVNLRDLAAREPILLLAVSETCGSCTPVIESAEAYRKLLPEVSVRLLVQSTPEASALTSAEEPQTLHDPHKYVSGSIADPWFTPTALLLGSDGMLAGGPVLGAQEIAEFVDDVYESLHGERPPAS
ncbi:MauE/DoxX family redox-associated membrane protein [Microbacterium panaciterrae]|uniref:Methylamine utilisation protein MauE domain-containing protein n=1 Tax=Microbacterium panaciterrae TaxID=985759 RepID=A0ABP8PH23_9MICO